VAAGRKRQIKKKGSSIRQSSDQASARREIAHLEDIPNIGPTVAADLRQLGITTPAELPGRDPYAMYDEVCCIPASATTLACSTRSSPQSGSWRERQRSLGGSTRQNASENCRHEIQQNDNPLPRRLVHLPLRRQPDHPRFHLESVEAGRRVSVFKIDPGTGERLGLLATITVGEGGWVDLPEQIIVRADFQPSEEAGRHHTCDPFLLQPSKSGTTWKRPLPDSGQAYHVKK